MPQDPNGNSSRAISAAEHVRRQLLDQMSREIDALAADYHARLPRGRATSIGAFYARFSTKYQHSVGDQIRALFEAAVATGIYVPREFIFFDVAVRGTQNRRPGLDALRAILERKDREAGVLMIFATNRLFRKTFLALQFVEETVDLGVRCIFLSSGIDTADHQNWRMMHQVHAMTDEAVGGMSANHIRAAHEGLFARGLVTGSLPLGFRGREVPGETTRRNLPRRAVEVDPDTAPWVVRVFRWFADDRLSIGEIARRLNADPHAPRGRQFVTDHWTGKTVRNLLANPRYTGLWQYGVTRNVWLNKKDYSRQIRRAEPLKSARRDDLRIIDDDLWERARHRLQRNDRSAAGRKPRDGKRTSRPLLLNGIFHCAAHDQMMYVGGPHGHMHFCRTCRVLPAGDRSLYSMLNREQAVARTCRVLAELIQADPHLISRAIEACRDQAAALLQPDPARIKSLKARHDGLTRQIDFVTRDPGETDFDREESRMKLKQLRSERGQFAAELAALEQARDRPAILPDESQVRELIGRLGEILTAAASSHQPEDVARAREVVELLTGGRIDLFQMGERKAQRGWLQGRFRPRLLEGLVAKLTGLTSEPGTEPDAAPVTIDYDSPSPSEAIADRAKDLFDQGLLIKAIATELEITKNLARKALAHWYRRRGLPQPDGRTRRSTLLKKHLEPPRFIAISGDVMRRFHAGLPYDIIAAECECDRTTVAKVIGLWHKEQRLPIPDGRNRRKERNRLRGREADRTTPPAAA